jgi:hypothetical protein
MSQHLGHTGGEPMDRSDLELLTDVVDLYDELDPMPDMLPDLVLFALEAADQCADLDAELARLIEAEMAVPVGARAVEQARRVTFSSEHLTVMIAVQDLGDGTVRLDGWAAPGGSLRVELRTETGVRETVCDVAGRFVFDAVRSGKAQLTLLPGEGSDPDVRVPVVTPAIHL